MASREDYPYTVPDHAPGACKNGSARTNAVKIGGYVSVPANSYADVMAAVATVGPLSIVIDASFGNYESGVYDGCSKATMDLDHGMQMVGYGTEGGVAYWLVRNSWGTGWGDQGYIKIQRYADDATRPCGVDNSPGDGMGCKGGPTSIKPCGSCGLLWDTSYPTNVTLA